MFHFESRKPTARGLKMFFIVIMVVVTTVETVEVAMVMMEMPTVTNS